MQPRTDRRRRGYAAVLAVREFRAVLAAQLLSDLGTVVCEIGLSVLVFRLTGSPLLSALGFAVGLLPYVLGGALLSAVADRVPVRALLVCCNLLCAGCAAGMVAPGTPVALLLLLRCAAALVAPVFSGARAGTLGEILGEGDLFVLGRSLLRLVNQGAQLAGFALGGVLLAAFSPRQVLLLTVTTFLGSATLLRLGTRARPARQGASVGSDGVVVRLRPGALLVDSWRSSLGLLADRRIRALLLLCWTPPTFVVVSESLLTPYSAALRTGPVGLGLLMCGMPVGAITGEALAGSLLGPRGRARLTRPVALLAMLPSAAYAFHPDLAWALVCQLLTGCGISYSLGLDQWFVAAVPERSRGRAMTFMVGGLMTAQGLGMSGAGALGAACVATVLYALRRAVPSPAELPAYRS
jgi:MFS family permease